MNINFQFVDCYVKLAHQCLLNDRTFVSEATDLYVNDPQMLVANGSICCCVAFGAYHNVKMEIFVVSKIVYSEPIFM